MSCSRLKTSTRKGDAKTKEETRKKKVAYNSIRLKTLYKRYTLAFNKATDDDIIKKLDSVTSKPDYIRQLIKKDISK